VIHHTALLEGIEFNCFWLVGPCSSASATIYNSAETDGTTYSHPPIGIGIYPAYWTVPFLYTTIAVDIATTYHTAAIVRTPKQRTIN
jgi:hypothetical protein